MLFFEQTLGWISSGTVLSDRQQIMYEIYDQLRVAIGSDSSIDSKIPNSQFYLRKHSIITGLTFPCVIIFPARDTYEDTTNLSYDIGYGIQVTIAQAGNKDLTTDQERLQNWRELAINALSGKRLNTNSVVAHKVICEHGPVFDAPAYLQNYDATSFVARCFVRKTNRGV